MARLNADGTVDATFNPNANGGVNSIVVQANGNILVVGDFTKIGGQARNYIARLNADGSLDTAFNPNANDFILSTAMQADGKILVGGYFTFIGGQTRNKIARLNADGSLNTTFNPSANDLVFSIAVQADGKILVGGYFTFIGGQTRNKIARLNADGSLDTTFNPNATNYVLSIAVQVDGKILVGGNFTTIGEQTRKSIARFSADDAALQNLTVSGNGTTITWMRGQSSPEVFDVTFERSPDMSVWTGLGAGTRIAGGWQLTGQSLLFNVNDYIRARGRASGGQHNGSTSLVESIRQYYNSAPPIPTPTPTPVVNADFYASPTLSMVKHEIKFFDQSSGEPNQWDWDFGDTNHATVPNPVHAYDAPGTYTVSLAVSGPYGADAETKKDYIVIKHLPTEKEFADFLLGRTESLDVDLNGDGKIDVADLVWLILSK
jgi:uncharacterized delta-60 repeat protein